MTQDAHDTSPTSDAGLRIGVDVGGTNTDAVLLDGTNILQAIKVPTTVDVSDGIRSAISKLDAGRNGRPVDAVIIGTTHFMNAIVQARDVVKVGIIRLATPGQTLVPMIEWPTALHSAIAGGVAVVPGGHQFTGQEIAPLDEVGLAAAAQQMIDKGVRHIVISAVFSPVEHSHEVRAAEIVQEMLGDDGAVVRSHDIGQLSILERENASILNAAMLPLAARIVDSFASLTTSLGATTATFLSQNDGTLMNLDVARRFPIFTVSSGPTNSMRGAAMLSNTRDAVVIDVGGTTSDVGLLQHGFPRESVVSIELAGVRTNFRMPDVTSLAIGGGTIIGDDLTVGPASVGFRLTEQARVFGGPTLTMTDIAVAAGLADLGDRSLVADVSADTIAAVMDTVRQRLANAVIAARLSSAEIPTVVVGGGGFIVDQLPGRPDVIRPEHGDVANALGAALAQVSGSVDSIYSLAEITREEALALARQTATERAVAAGAIPTTVTIIDEEDVPLAHLPGGTATRVRVTAVGDLSLKGA